MVLENDQGTVADPVSGRNEFAALLGSIPRARLVVLNLCRGAQAGPEIPRCQENDPFVGVAQALIAAGMPAVVAMDYAIGDMAASRFSPTLLASVARNIPLDEAVRQGRTRLANVPELTRTGGEIQTIAQWCIPACLMHDDGHNPWLFHLLQPHRGQLPPPNPLAEGKAAVSVFEDSGLIDQPVPAVR